MRLQERIAELEEFIEQLTERTTWEHVLGDPACLDLDAETRAVVASEVRMWIRRNRPQ